MKILYLTPYFNYNNDKSLRRRFIDFCSMYPEVFSIQFYSGEDEICPVLNTFLIQTSRKRFYSFEILFYFRNLGYSIVFMDCDLIIPKGLDFLSESIEKSGLEVAQCFGKVYQIENVEICPGIKSIMSPSEGDCIDGHTGHIWYFSHKFLRKIDFTFPSNLFIGSLDLIFAYCILGDERIITLYDNEFYWSSISALYFAVKSTLYGFIDLEIFHRSHGSSIRYDRFEDYSMIKRDYTHDFNWSIISRYFNTKRV